jgi:glycosyltransferase involved in cell wall biosynthesis
MNVVIVAYYATWTRSAGSRRVTAIALRLAEEGHAVTVLAAQPRTGDRQGGSPLEQRSSIDIVELPASDRVARINSVLTAVRRRLNRGMSRAQGEAAAASATGSEVRRGRLVSALIPWISFPDTMWGWHRTATACAANLGARPVDLVIATSPPMACLRAGSALARHFGCPWIADLRDLWTGDPYRRVPLPLRWLDRRLERSTLRSAATIVTVAEPLADDLRRQGPPVVVIPNGFAQDWLRPDCPQERPADEPPSIVYTGTLRSSSHRDLSPILTALGRTAHLPRPPRLEIYGSVDPTVANEIAAAGLADRVVLHGSVEPDEARRAQHRAAVLLSLGWDDPRDLGSTPAKLFEYAAARRPIVHVGEPRSVGSRLIVEHRLGRSVSSGDVDTICKVLEEYLGDVHSWTPPTTAELAPLSQSRMTAQFLTILETIVVGAYRPRP